MPMISTPNEAQELLSEYLVEENEDSAQELLGKLVSIHATPVIRRAIAQRLGYGIDTEDVYGYTVVRLVTQLKDHRRHGSERSIDDFGAYVAVAAYNACHDHLRRKFPERHKLRIDCATPWFASLSLPCGRTPLVAGSAESLIGSTNQ